MKAVVGDRVGPDQQLKTEHPAGKILQSECRHSFASFGATCSPTRSAIPSRKVPVPVAGSRIVTSRSRRPSVRRLSRKARSRALTMYRTTSTGV